ncbi:MAG TPA: trypsin-like peptidase domain-containing protein [Candidatus Hypogeohydataceae bacterium YC38]
MKVLIVHLSGSKRGRTEVFGEESIRVGTDPDSQLRFDPLLDKSTSPFHAQIECRDGEYLLKDLVKGTFVNNQQVEEKGLQDGDLIEFGLGGPKVRFRMKPEKGDIRKPFREMVADSLAIAREQRAGGLITASIFLKEFVWEVLTQSSLRFRVALALVFLLSLIAVPSLFTSRKLEEKMEYQAKRLETLEAKGIAAEKIIKDFSGGVCLIQGSYYFGEEVPETGVPLITYDYTGTGFLVSSDGKVLTNRHIAQPWWRMPGRHAPAELGFTPKFLEFRAFFPGVEEPFRMEVERVSDTADLALARLDTRGVELPVLEFDFRDIAVGEPVVVIGYPAGISAILARMEKAVVDELVYSRKLGFLELASELSRRSLVRPLSTQGHVSDMLEDRLVFDAQTTIGGSGGPIFDRAGKVIGVTYGIFTGFTGSNFAIPSRFAKELLEVPTEKVSLGTEK